MFLNDLPKYSTTINRENQRISIDSDENSVTTFPPPPKRFRTNPVIIPASDIQLDAIFPKQTSYSQQSSTISSDQLTSESSFNESSNTNVTDNNSSTIVNDVSSLIPSTTADRLLESTISLSRYTMDVGNDSGKHSTTHSNDNLTSETSSMTDLNTVTIDVTMTTSTQENNAVNSSTISASDHDSNASLFSLTNRPTTTQNELTTTITTPSTTIDFLNPNMYVPLLFDLTSSSTNEKSETSTDPAWLQYFSFKRHHRKETATPIISDNYSTESENSINELITTTMSQPDLTSLNHASIESVSSLMPDSFDFSSISTPLPTNDSFFENSTVSDFPDYSLFSNSTDNISTSATTVDVNQTLYLHSLTSIMNNLHRTNVELIGDDKSSKLVDNEVLNNISNAVESKLLYKLCEELLARLLPNTPKSSQEQLQIDNKTANALFSWLSEHLTSTTKNNLVNEQQTTVAPPKSLRRLSITEVLSNLDELPLDGSLTSDEKRR
ncbi:unnamed protein product [Didymodactylos carnosus]|nr:unnamed protein product [Didymodactylos carnosus]CAF3836014.1 unnamed protein product [Didymodactylos carnosus]